MDWLGHIAFAVQTQRDLSTPQLSSLIQNATQNIPVQASNTLFPFHLGLQHGIQIHPSLRFGQSLGNNMIVMHVKKLLAYYYVVTIEAVQMDLELTNTLFPLACQELVWLCRAATLFPWPPTAAQI